MVIVLNSADGTVSLIDRHSYTEVKRYPIGKEPHHLEMTPDNKELIVAIAILERTGLPRPGDGNREASGAAHFGSLSIGV